MVNIEETVQGTRMKRLTKLRKDIAKYDEHVNRCDISATNVLAESIGADIDFLRYSGSKITEDEKRAIEQLEKQFSGHMDHLKRCMCVKKIEK
jgi:hypothetical protein